MFEDEFDTDRLPSAHGIQHCLQMLAEEADDLNMARTRAAIEHALKICSDEGSDNMPIGIPARPSFTRIH